MGINCVLAIGDFNNSFTTHGTGIAGITPFTILLTLGCAFQDGIVHGRAVDGFPFIKNTAVVVVGWQCASRLVSADDISGAIFRQSGDIRFRQVVHAPFSDLV